MSLKNDAPEEHDNVKFITLMGWKKVSNLDLCALISPHTLPITSSTLTTKGIQIHRATIA
jgi:hypothetical protein